MKLVISLNTIINFVVNKISENIDKWPSHYPQSLCDMIKLLSLLNSVSLRDAKFTMILNREQQQTFTVEKLQIVLKWSNWLLVIFRLATTLFCTRRLTDVRAGSRASTVLFSYIQFTYSFSARFNFTTTNPIKAMTFSSSIKEKLSSLISHKNIYSFSLLIYYFPDIDECLLYPHICEDPAKCVNTPGMYECQCPPGFKYNFTSKACSGETFSLISDKLTNK